MYIRLVIAFGLLVCTAVVAALILMDHVRLLSGNWADEATGVTALALLTIAATVAAAGCGIAAFVSRALTIGGRD
jgi:hypothetical protein